MALNMLNRKDSDIMLMNASHADTSSSTSWTFCCSPALALSEAAYLRDQAAWLALPVASSASIGRATPCTPHPTSPVQAALHTQHPKLLTSGSTEGLSERVRGSVLGAGVTDLTGAFQFDFQCVQASGPEDPTAKQCGTPLVESMGYFEPLSGFVVPFRRAIVQRWLQLGPSGPGPKVGGRL
jgi:hypothetical protein